MFDVQLFFLQLFGVYGGVISSFNLIEWLFQKLVARKAQARCWVGLGPFWLRCHIIRISQLSYQVEAALLATDGIDWYHFDGLGASVMQDQGPQAEQDPYRNGSQPGTPRPDATILFHLGIFLFLCAMHW